MNTTIPKQPLEKSILCPKCGRGQKILIHFIIDSKGRESQSFDPIPLHITTKPRPSKAKIQCKGSEMIVKDKNYL